MANACEPCTRDDQCSSEVCDLDLGACLDEAAVVYASPEARGSSTCSKAEPCSIISAFAVANIGRETIKLAAGIYSANIVVADKRVVVRGEGATLQSSSPNATLTIQNRARVRLFGLTVVNTNDGNGSAQAIDCSNGVDRPFLEMDSVTLDAMRSVLVVRGCNATMLRSRVHGRGVAFKVNTIDDGELTMHQSIVEGSGTGGFAAAQGGLIRVVNSIVRGQQDDALFALTGAVVFSYSTIIDSIIECGTTGTASCVPPVFDGACFDNTIVFNSVLGAPANTVSGSRCTYDTSIIAPQATAVAGANNMLGVNPLLVDVPGGDFHLQASSAAIDAADSDAVEVVDFDGTPRPQGLRNDIGAFERVP